ncbi:phosphatidate cytidylyltransferase [Treponema sp. J25]|uniref:diacylglycerol/polyprenol kinase family protein n=1 Tax=Treponema sp. J25 TaxID=2094121 RepID=UPI00104E3691|nr:phosphatidate cytidylyltransferase [Treponema sp. J25]TCW60207.1 phosphatidate cytidylyltransferase [Treponema sp. J25]
MKHSIEGISEEIKTELVRKSIHLMIAVAPSLAAIDRSFTMFLLSGGVLLYTYLENLRREGVSIPLISTITLRASRKRDEGRFVMGPITLGLGALLALLLYPSPASSVAIYSLAFGDGFASLVGKLAGRYRPTWLMGKSLEGSLACFVAVLLVSYRITQRLALSVVVALVTTIIEALPLEDFDNILIPVAAGFTVMVLL